MKKQGDILASDNLGVAVVQVDPQHAIRFASFTAELVDPRYGVGPDVNPFSGFDVVVALFIVTAGQS